MFTLSEGFHDDSEVEEAEEEDIEFFETGKDSAVALETAGQALYLIVLLVVGAIISRSGISTVEIGFNPC
jgi:hypothetical protein